MKSTLTKQLPPTLKLISRLTKEQAELINKAQDYATEYHSSTNHLYDGKPYADAHLSMVYNYAKKYSYLLKDEDVAIALASAWTHDVIEDCRQTYNDVKKVCGVAVAEVTFALTNEKGRTRKDRANTKYYDGIVATSVATYIKICDRLANAMYSKTNGSLMIDAYRKEQGYFKHELFTEEYQDMWNELDAILSSKV